MEAYYTRLRKNELRIKLKNAIMQKWTRIKQENAPADISALVDQMLKKKRTAQNEGPNYNNNQSQEDREAK